MKKRLIQALTFCLLLPAAWLPAQDVIDARMSVDWRARKLFLDAELILSGPEVLSPRLRSSSEQAIYERLPVLMREKTAALALDSSLTVGVFTQTNPLFLKRLDDFSRSGLLERSYLSVDMKKFTARYAYNLSSLGSIFVNHTTPMRLPDLFSYEPSASFSGLVVYMKIDLPVVGELEREGPDKGRTKQGRLKPCMFPKIYDEDMNLVLEKGMMKPDFLKNWGAVAYRSGLDIPVERVGFTPLRILGRAIYGVGHTDIVISSDAARKLLSNENNRRLLTEGRIVVICYLE